MNDGKTEEKPGEGNRAADRRYRKGVRETVRDLGLDEEEDSARESTKTDEDAA